MFRIKVYPLGLHTKGQQPIDDAFQNAYIATPFVSFGAKSYPMEENLYKIRTKIQTLFKFNINQN
jgi:hypothetical protein